MRPANFLLSLLPLAGYSLASSQECGIFEQDFPSTGVGPPEFVAIISRMTFVSGHMLGESRNADERAASKTLDKLIRGVAMESHTLLKYIPRLEDTASFQCIADRLVIGVTFAKWQKTTGDFLVALNKSSETLHQGARYYTSRLADELASFRNATAGFSRPFRAIMSTNPLTPTEGYMIARSAMGLDRVFQDTILKLRQKESLKG